MTRNGYPRGQERTPILRGYLTCFAVVLLTIGVFGRSSKLPGLRIKTHGGEMGSPSLVEAAVRPKERTAMILSQIEREMLRQKDRDHQWDDQIDVRCHFMQ